MTRAPKLERAEARTMAAGAIAEAARIGVVQTVCVVDEGGIPILVDGAAAGGTGLAVPVKADIKR